MEIGRNPSARTSTAVERQRQRRQQRRWRAVLVAMAAVFGGSLVLACELPSSPGAPSCDPAACPAGNDCIDDHSGKGPVCLPVCTHASQCPAGTFCNDAQPKSWCQAIHGPGASVDAAAWGKHCTASQGETSPECDQAHGFRCFGTNPTDANAFCTFYDCQSDADCKTGYGCTEVNTAPNVMTATRSYGDTRFWCLPRTYCSPCTLDHDCPLSPDGTQQHCVADSKGSRFCSPECTSSDACALDATCQPLSYGLCGSPGCRTDGDCPSASQRCVAGACHLACAADADCKSNAAETHCRAPADAPDQKVCLALACQSDEDCPLGPAGFFQHCDSGTCASECAADGDCARGQSCHAFAVCQPRAGVCKGNGQFCDPCRTDYDCRSAGGGFCLVAPYSSERFCSAPVANGVDCATVAATGGTLPKGSCPGLAMGANYTGVSCTTATDDFSPANECIGTVTFAGQVVPGCWTVNR